MPALDISGTSARPRRLKRLGHLAAGIGSVLLITAWCFMLPGVHPAWPAVVLASLAALLAAVAYALNIRPQPGRLLRFGKDTVQVRSLDEWTLYQYDLLFEQGSPEQQHEALMQYRVGLRLFPARPQDQPVRQGALQWLLAPLTFCSFLTLSETIHGWHRILLLLAFYAWMWVCLRLSKRLADVPASNGLTGLELS